MSEDNRPTIRTRVPLVVSAEVETLRKAMKGMGTDEAAIINVLTSCSTNQRQVLAEEYHKEYDRDLIKDLKKELSGEFENVVMAMMRRNDEYLAKELEHAIEMKNGEVIVQILFGCDPPQMMAIKAAYERDNDDTLEEDLEDETKGIFEDILVATVTGQRQGEDECCEVVSENVARAIFDDDHGVNKDEIVKAFSTLSYQQLKAIFVEYYKVADRTLGDAFDLAFDGKEKTNMQAIFQCIDNRYAFFAAALHKAMAGPGTKDRDLIRLIVSRAELDLMNIKEEYYKMYNSHLEEDVKGDTSGDYKRMLLALLQPNY